MSTFPTILYNTMLDAKKNAEYNRKAHKAQINFHPDFFVMNQLVGPCTSNSCWLCSDQQLVCKFESLSISLAFLAKQDCYVIISNDHFPSGVAFN